MRSLLRLTSLCAVLLLTALAATTALADDDRDDDDRPAKAKPAKPAKPGKPAEEAQKPEKDKDEAGQPGGRVEDAGKKDERAEEGSPPASAPGRERDRDERGRPAEQPRGDAPGRPALLPPRPEDIADDDPDVTPQLAETVASEPVSGTILVRLPGSGVVQPLSDDAPLPVGTIVDARAGLVEIVAAADASGARQQAIVHGSVFTIRQERAAAPVTELALTGGDFDGCDDDGGSAEAASGEPRARTARRRGRAGIARGIWAAGKGRFRTRGRHSAATVRGTRWATVDRCHSTTTKVFEGVVDVQDLTLGRTVAVQAGERHVAREPRR